MESDGSLSYAGNVSEWQALPDRIAENGVDIILADIDWTVDDLDDIGGLSQIPPVLLLAEDVESSYAALATGFRGVLLRESAVEEILAGIAALAAGLAVADPRILALIQDGPSIPDREASDFEALSPREIEVLGLISHGYPNKAIALELGISEHTVKFHVGSILTKLNAASRSEAVAVAIRHGMVAV